MSHNVDVLRLTREVVAIDSVTHRSNVAVADFLQETLEGCGFEVERLEYLDREGLRKVDLVGKKGRGQGGLGFFSHCDTVPGTGWEQQAWSPEIKDGRLTGLGSCDMKGPLAATIAAGAAINANQLRNPVFIVITADEENASLGASHLVKASELFRAAPPQHGVIAEPTRMIPVYAHKGAALVTVTARGIAAHTSTDKGISSNFIIAPFLAEMAELARLTKTDSSFQNSEFQPPTLGFNMVISDDGCKPNVSASKTVCTLCFRPMPNDRSRHVLETIAAKAAQHQLEVSPWVAEPFYVSPQARIVQTALRACGLPKAETVSFCSDAVIFKDYLELVILGPGDIAQAHTVGEWVDTNQLLEATQVYGQMIQMLCAE
ncbi:MAG: M20 family metallopeptidase [Acidimicrobiia bacterium]|nr:M20 family metallopeptidase [Acidimicrobiia bacterium]